jgi:hypothetical protein
VDFQDLCQTTLEILAGWEALRGRDKAGEGGGEGREGQRSSVKIRLELRSSILSEPFAHITTQHPFVAATGSTSVLVAAFFVPPLEGAEAEAGAAEEAISNLEP